MGRWDDHLALKLFWACFTLSEMNRLACTLAAKYGSLVVGQRMMIESSTSKR